MDHPDGFPRSRITTSQAVSIFGISLGDAFFSTLEFGYLWFVLALVGHSFFDPKGEYSALVLAGSAYLAGFVVAYEIRAIVIPGIFARGRAFLGMGGLTIDAVKGGFVRIAAAMGVRLAMAASFSMAVVLCISALIFKADEDSFIHAQIQDQNAALVEKTTAAVNGRIEMRKAALADTIKRTQELSAELTTLRRKTNASPRRRDLQDRLASTEAAYAARDAEVTRLRDEVDGLMAARADTIANDVRHAPDYAEAPRGLLAEVKALKALADSDPTARAMIISFDLFFLSLELALLMSKVVEMMPSAFAGEKVYALYVKAVRLAKMAAAEAGVDELDLPPPPPGDIMPPANDNGASPVLEPSLGAMAAPERPNGLDEPPPPPPRRPRGRPRKDSFN